MLQRPQTAISPSDIDVVQTSVPSLKYETEIVYTRSPSPKFETETIYVTAPLPKLHNEIVYVPQPLLKQQPSSVVPPVPSQNYKAKAASTPAVPTPAPISKRHAAPAPIRKSLPVSTNASSSKYRMAAAAVAPTKCCCIAKVLAGVVLALMLVAAIIIPILIRMKGSTTTTKSTTTTTVTTASTSTSTTTTDTTTTTETTTTTTTTDTSSTSSITTSTTDTTTTSSTSTSTSTSTTSTDTTTTITTSSSSTSTTSTSTSTTSTTSTTTTTTPSVPLTVSEVQKNFDPATLPAGWTLCYNDTYDVVLNSLLLTSILTQCNRGKLLLGCRPIKELAAMGLRSDVLYDCGNVTSCTHVANGVGWYYSSDYSWGFVENNDTVYRSSCDTDVNTQGATNADLRLCWHTGSTYGGYRCGSNIGLNSDTNFVRVIYNVD